MELIWTQ